MKQGSNMSQEQINSLYSAPESELSTAETSATQVQLFTSSITKIIVLSVFTLGLYNLYWHFKQWQFQKRYAGHDCIPVLRAIFQLFFTHALFATVAENARIQQIKFSWNNNALATIYILLLVLSNFSDKLLPDPVMGFLLSVLITFALLAIVCVVQKTINQINGDPQGSQNAQFTPWNWLAIVLGAAFWALILFGAAFAV